MTVTSGQCVNDVAYLTRELTVTLKDMKLNENECNMHVRQHCILDFKLLILCQYF
jgi:hypothetical protein